MRDYESIAWHYAKHRSPTIGVTQVRAWAAGLPPDAAVLDLGCGNGVPLAQVLIEHGLDVHGVDASPTMMAAFSARFPEAKCECGTVEASCFFNRTFHGILAWGVVFLLPRAEQPAAIRKMALALQPGGRLLFTAPTQICEWKDTLTEQASASLGRDVYRELLVSAGLHLLDEHDDEGSNHYYSAFKPAP